MAQRECGTLAGYQQHHKHNEQVCDACAEAHRLYARQWRWRSGRQHDLVRCRSCGSVFPAHTCGSPQDSRIIYTYPAAEAFAHGEGA